MKSEFPVDIGGNTGPGSGDDNIDKGQRLLCLEIENLTGNCKILLGF